MVLSKRASKRVEAALPLLLVARMVLFDCTARNRPVFALSEKIGRVDVPPNLLTVKRSQAPMLVRLQVIFWLPFSELTNLQLFPTSASTSLLDGLMVLNHWLASVRSANADIVSADNVVSSNVVSFFIVFCVSLLVYLQST